MIKPVLTEKAVNLSKNNKYVFWVDGRINKLSIKSEVAKTYKVDVVSVRTLRIGKRKKAIVTLKANQKIDIYKGKKENEKIKKNS